MKYKVCTLIIIVFVITGCTGASEPTPTLTPTSPKITPTLPPPPFVEDGEFPTGIFESAEGSEGIIEYEFREDGSGLARSLRDGWQVPFKFGVNGDLYSEMTFEYPGGKQVPATYHWTFDGNELTFQLWGNDLRPHRNFCLAKHPYYIKSYSDGSLETDGSEFPTGRFIHEEDSSRAFEFDEDGAWRYYEGDLQSPQFSGKYTINGMLYTEMTNDYPTTPKVPVTYYWTFDGKHLSFNLWGEDANSQRKGIYDDQTYIFLGDSDS